LWFLNGHKVVALTAETATIEISAGVRLTYRRKPAQPGQTLPWLLR
jgi:hypothetical protein